MGFLQCRLAAIDSFLVIILREIAPGFSFLHVSFPIRVSDEAALPAGGMPAGSGLGFESFPLAGNWQFVSVSEGFAWGEREAEMQNVRWEVWECFGLCHCLSP